MHVHACAQLTVEDIITRYRNVYHDLGHVEQMTWRVVLLVLPAICDLPDSSFLSFVLLTAPRFLAFTIPLSTLDVLQHQIDAVRIASWPRILPTYRST